MIKKLLQSFSAPSGWFSAGAGAPFSRAAFPSLGHRLCRCCSGIWSHRSDHGICCRGISGGHFNPAVSFGLAVSGKFKWGDVVPYIIAQSVGGALAGCALYAIASGKSGFIAAGFASNGFGAHSPGGYSMVACATAEIILTAFFLIVILGSTSKRVPAALPPSPLACA
ncbi:MAG: aquaporin [Asticcacaulis sp.]